jgi:hypothetical protein
MQMYRKLSLKCVFTGSLASRGWVESTDFFGHGHSHVYVGINRNSQGGGIDSQELDRHHEVFDVHSGPQG